METVIVDPDSVRLFKVPRPLRRFSDTVTESLTPVRGLRDVGPYDVNTTDPHLRRDFTRCEVVCVFPSGDLEIRRDLARLTGYLADGYDPTRPQGDTDFHGFAIVFRLDRAAFPAEPEFLEYDLRDLSPFRETVLERLTEAKMRGNRLIALVAVRSHKTIAGTKDIYTPIKRLLNRSDVPNQFLSDYQTQETNLGVLYQISSGMPVGWSLWGVALAMYTKLGGMPWAVTQSGEPEEHIDITIGLRFARLDPARKGFCLGVATVLDRSGRLIGTVPLEDLVYHRVVDTPLPGMTLSAESAQTLVTKALDSVLLDPRTQPVMQTRKPLSVVMHKLGPGQFHAEEIRGITQAMDVKLRGRDVKVAFVPVVSAETLAAFGPPSQGRAMPEGQCLRLTGDTALLYTMPSDKRFSTPITVKLQNLGSPECAFGTVEQACAHAQTLCGLHWQMVATGRLRLPADLDVASRIAQGFANDVQPKVGSWLWKTQWYN